MSTQGEANKRLVAAMYEGLNENVTGVMGRYWFEDMVWAGPAGIGTKRGIEAFEQEMRAPFIRAFPDKRAEDFVRIAEGDWMAGVGYQTATFARDWLGIPASGRQVRVRYMDFWRIEERAGERKLLENHVLIDILDVLAQAGYDVGKVLQFIGSKPPEFFADQEEERSADDDNLHTP